MGRKNKAFNATNEEGTCRWCGERLRRHYRVEFVPLRETRRVPTGAPDGYDGFFCTQTCAAQLGRELVLRGYTLTPRG